MKRRIHGMSVVVAVGMAVAGRQVLDGSGRERQVRLLDQRQRRDQSFSERIHANSVATFQRMGARRLEILKQGASHYLPEPCCEPVQEQWFGSRPMTYDGMPVIDRSPVLDNVFIAAGHSMLGLSMAPATGKLIAELLTEKTPHLDPTPFLLAGK